MQSKTLRTVSLLGIQGAALFTTSSQAHECRALGQVNAEGSLGDPSATPPVPPHAVDDAYWVCIGFSEEEPPQPGEGLPNNLDFFPLFAPGNDFNNVSSVDTTKGDKVDITATLYYLNDKYYVIPYDADFNITFPFFFFKSSGVGYESPISRCGSMSSQGTAQRDGVPLVVPLAGGGQCRAFEKQISPIVRQEWEGLAVYRGKMEFPLPFPGTYAWVVKGTIQKKDQPPATFTTKVVSQQPRVPYGPYDLTDIENTLVQAPENYFDSARPKSLQATKPATATAAYQKGSPKVTEFIRRMQTNN
ncbi:MAG TPA: hypothetical protein VIE66_04660 [Methylocella sp.]|jgi:hypothetical protein